MTTISKTAAIRQAMGHVSICGSGTSYHVYGPYRAAEPRGPSSEITADSYPKALMARCGWRAKIALARMGRLDMDTSFAVEEAVHDVYADHSVGALVTQELAHADKWASAPAGNLYASGDADDIRQTEYFVPEGADWPSR